LVYAIPNIQTVEFSLLSKCSNIIVFYWIILMKVPHPMKAVFNDVCTHPFHYHGHKFWVMAQGDGIFNYSAPLPTTPIFRDTVSVRTYLRWKF
jgi:hypothetical protein